MKNFCYSSLWLYRIKLRAVPSNLPVIEQDTVDIKYAVDNTFRIMKIFWDHVLVSPIILKPINSFNSNMIISFVSLLKYLNTAIVSFLNFSYPWTSRTDDCLPARCAASDFIVYCESVESKTVSLKYNKKCKVLLLNALRWIDMEILNCCL